MRVIKLGLISIFFLFIVVTAISLLLPSTIHISRAIDINAPVDSVLVQLSDLSNWKNWLASYDNAKTTLPAKTTGKGANIVINKTTITIVSSTADKIETTWLSGSKSLTGEFNVFKHQASSQLTVQWHFIQYVQWYPWEKFASIVSDKVMSPAMEKSLDNLKNVVENQAR